jgi:hypothetical protein
VIVSPGPIINPALNVFLYAKDLAGRANRPTASLDGDSFVRGMVFTEKDAGDVKFEWVERFHKEPTSSWRRMLFTQPAVSLYSGSFAQRMKHFSEDWTVQDDNGVRVGMVHEMLSNCLRDCGACQHHHEIVEWWSWHGGEEVDCIKKKFTGWEIFKEIQEH